MSAEGHVIKTVDPGSIGAALGLGPGDRLLKINGREIEDIFDYEYQVDSPRVQLLVEKAGEGQYELEVENDFQDLGLTFENGLMSDYRSCSNNCIFCFIDQMPPGMRETLYFKDDDSRLSFLQGNYVTLTNMKDHDIKRIIEFKLAPINISVHTTNPELRCRMLHNRFAGEALKKIDTLFEAGIPMNGQIVLCRDINDGEELNQTIGDLSRYIPCMESVSVVPVGLSRYREGLYPLKAFDRESAASALAVIERWQEKLYREHGVHFIHASDEFYILAGRPMPEADRYDGFPQLENGVGMLRLLDMEVDEALLQVEEDFEGEPEPERLCIATGRLAAPYVEAQMKKIMSRYPQLSIQVRPIRNDFFGESITVAGLITGQDLKAQLSGCELGTRLLLPACMFRSGEEVFLDDMTREELQNALQVPVHIVKSSGQDLVYAVLGIEAEDDDMEDMSDGFAEYEGYELKEI
ncbi:MAG: DUF512 domain-containing protein [Eubacteriales bacterium]|nr:DUF512 domain-containing protein [Eubacteriales bacterium]